MKQTESVSRIVPLKQWLCVALSRSECDRRTFHTPGMKISKPQRAYRGGACGSRWNGKQKTQGDKSFGEMMDARGVIIGNQIQKL